MHRTFRHPTLLASAALAVVLTGCSSPRASRPAADNILGSSQYPAICYSGHRKVPRSVENTPTIAETKEDLRILSAMGIKLIRTYNTTLYPHSARILQSIRELKQENPDFEMFVMLGAWIQCKGTYTDSPDHSMEDEEQNQREIAAAIRLANEYPGIVKMIAVGNEAMVRWQVHFVPAKIILKYINVLSEARNGGRIPAATLLTTSDNWAALGGQEEYRNADLAELMQQMDLVSLHTYAFHDSYYNPALQWGPRPGEKKLTIIEQTSRAVERAIQLQKNQLQAVRNYLNSLGIDKEIHIGETGWASLDDSHYGDAGTRAAHEYTAGLFYEAVRKWTEDENMTCFYFEAFDEPWKSKSPSGSEAHFGLFTVDGKAKYPIWNLVDKAPFDGLSRGGNPITKTRSGDKAVLLKTLKAPKHLKFQP